MATTGKSRRWSRPLNVLNVIVAVAIVVFVCSQVFDLRITTADDSTFEPNFPPGGPKEFLYLDSARVDAYLGQVDGGTFESEKLNSKVANTISGQLEAGGVGGVGGSQSREESSEREVKPTEASRFLALFSALDEGGDLHRVDLDHFGTDIRPLREGDMVEFRVRSFFPPIYTNAYLATRDPGSAIAIFPGSDESRPANALARAGTKRFHRQLGEEPRAVFSLREAGEDPPQYLLPLQAELVSHERSLIKNGGGEFTVVGKLVRRFPEKGDSLEPAYVDSATRSEWERPIRDAPGELICRTEPRCVEEAQVQELKGPARVPLFGEARERERDRLREQTTIETRGAVILPIAIYK